MRERRAAVSARNITKGFGGQLALQGVDLTIEAATVHAVVGENGAGKSTLIKILTGVHEPDDGTLAVDGHEVTISTPRAARDLGIACIHQDLYLVPTMSVGENLFLASGYPSRGRTKINWRTVREEARKRLDVVDLDVDPQLRVGDLRPAQQQLVALAAALAQNPRILIMDEPTAALGASDSEHLLSLVAKHRDAGASIVFVSHRLDEVLQIADVITVLRDGQVVAHVQRSELTRPRLVELLGGAAKQASEEPAPVPRRRAARLSVTSLDGPGLDCPVNIEIGAGEIVGLAGLVGSGRSRLAHMLSGALAPTSGTIAVDGEPVTIATQRDAVRNGIVLVPSDRSKALVAGFGIAENISLGHVNRYTRFRMMLDKPAERRTAERFRMELGIKTGKADESLRSLSGGNQQKVLLARALDLEPRMLILDEPTAGIDIATKEYIYGLVRGLSASGVSSLFISSDLDELPLVCHRILAFSRGRMLAELPGNTDRRAIVAELFRSEPAVRGDHADGPRSTDPAPARGPKPTHYGGEHAADDPAY